MDVNQIQPISSPVNSATSLNNLALSLQISKIQLKIFHWNAKGGYFHEQIDKIADLVSDLSDVIAEASMVTNNNQNFVATLDKEVNFNYNTTSKEAFFEYVASIRSTVVNATHIPNIDVGIKVILEDFLKDTLSIMYRATIVHN